MVSRRIFFAREEHVAAISKKLGAPSTLLVRRLLKPPVAA